MEIERRVKRHDSSLFPAIHNAKYPSQNTWTGEGVGTDLPLTPTFIFVSPKEGGQVGEHGWLMPSPRGEGASRQRTTADIRSLPGSSIESLGSTDVRHRARPDHIGKTIGCQIQLRAASQSTYPAKLREAVTVEFAKLQGAGNDYIAIDGRGIDRDWGALSKEMSRLAFGVGSDGVVLVQESDVAQVRMRVYNPDGSEAEMSGNGIRLFSKFVIDRKIALPESDTLTVETGGGVRTVWPTMEGDKMVAARVAMGVPTFTPAEIPVDTALIGDLDIIKNYPIQAAGRELKITCLAIGNPHAVVIMDEPVGDFPLVEIGPSVENHKLFPNRINFEIVNVIDRSEIRARIFERGAGETLSSGTGSTAAASAARAHGLVDDAVDVIVDGGVLRISWDETGEAFLEGPAVEVFTGVWPD